MTKNEIQKIQDLYGEWIKMSAEIEKSLELWKHSTAIMQQLSEFYFNPEWLALHDSFDGNTLDTNGNYSVLSEDAIWNAFQEQRLVAMRFLKHAVTILDEEEKINNQPIL